MAEKRKLSDYGELVVNRAKYLGLDPEAELDLIERRKEAGHAGRMVWTLRVPKSDTAIIVDPGDWECRVVTVDNEYFKRRREYYKKCRSAAKKTGLPIGVCLAIGWEYAPEFRELITGIRHTVCSYWTKKGRVTRHYYYFVPYDEVQEDALIPNYEGFVADYYWELNCGIDRRKTALLSLLVGASDGLKERVEGLGQVNSERLADFFRRM